jgi:hypothetical protein
VQYRGTNAFFISLWRNSPQWARASSFTTFLDHTQRCNTVGRTPPRVIIIPTQRPLTDNTQHSQETDIRAAVGIRTLSPGKWAAGDPCPRPRYHYYRHKWKILDGINEAVLKVNARGTKCMFISRHQKAGQSLSIDNVAEFCHSHSPPPPKNTLKWVDICYRFVQNFFY